MILVIDNYDSFTYNLVQLMSAVGAEMEVFRNDEITVDEIESRSPEAIVVSPGPCTPNEAGVSVDTIKRLSGHLPILAVCLGHQSMSVAFGGQVTNASRIMHGKTSLISHDDNRLYKGLKNPFPAGRYHSLAVVRDTLPSCLVVNATSEDGEIMGMHHAEHPTWGLQFHPESVLTPGGKRLLRNFLEIVADSRG